MIELLLIIAVFAFWFPYALRKGAKIDRERYEEFARKVFPEQNWKIVAKKGGKLTSTATPALSVELDGINITMFDPNGYSSRGRGPRLWSYFFVELEHESGVQYVKNRLGIGLSKPISWRKYALSNSGLRDSFTVFAKDERSLRMTESDFICRLLEILKEDSKFVKLALIPKSIAKEKYLPICSEEAGHTNYRSGILLSRITPLDSNCEKDNQFKTVLDAFAMAAKELAKRPY